MVGHQLDLPREQDDTRGHIVDDQSAIDDMLPWG